MVQGQRQGFDEEAKVDVLINESTKQWDREKILNMLGLVNAAVIQRIQVSSIGAEDKLMWLGTKDGGFTVKSAYHIQKDLSAVHRGQPSHGALNFKNWTCFWKFKIPNATKAFVWRACLESLPTKLNLFKKKIVDSPLCPICCRSEETVAHILWNCSSAMDVWSNGPMIFQKSSRRNKHVFEGSFMPPKLLAQNAAQQLADFKAAQLAPTSATRMHANHAATWTPPPKGVNWNAALREAHDKVGLGLVACDHAGNIVASKLVAKNGYVIPLLAEALGAFQAAVFASELNLSSVILEDDSLQVVQGLNFHKERLDSVGMVLLDT
ncbi:uncharacterized protein LOC122296649 [Carya illinoinensis]|uniref:uncharacterized protein LOC122296649 n=1 Tax=Carya illinoinensis TaxID=32201 RepID=UPI001C721D86|nr:uncharacterized protein LOC122296649 [Carya illinoinensis]